MATARDPAEGEKEVIYPGFTLVFSEKPGRVISCVQSKLIMVTLVSLFFSYVIPLRSVMTLYRGWGVEKTRNQGNPRISLSAREINFLVFFQKPGKNQGIGVNVKPAAPPTTPTVLGVRELEWP